MMMPCIGAIVARVVRRGVIRVGIGLCFSSRVLVGELAAAWMWGVMEGNSQ